MQHATVDGDSKVQHQPLTVTVARVCVGRCATAIVALQFILWSLHFFISHVAFALRQQTVVQR